MRSMSSLPASASCSTKAGGNSSGLLRQPMGRRATKLFGILSMRTMSLVAVRRSLSATAKCGLDARSGHVVTLRTA